MDEVWKCVPGYEDRYMVSNKGRIKSIDVYVNGGHGEKCLRKGKIKDTWINNNGYVIVKLTRNYKSKSAIVHRIVAEAFLPNPENKPCVNHIDFNRSNNEATNLEWVTYNENANHTINAGAKRFPKGYGGSKLNPRDVIEIRRLRDEKRMKITDISAKYNMSIRAISSITIRKSWKFLLSHESITEWREKR